MNEQSTVTRGLIRVHNFEGRIYTMAKKSRKCPQKFWGQKLLGVQLRAEYGMRGVRTRHVTGITHSLIHSSPQIPKTVALVG